MIESRLYSDDEYRRALRRVGRVAQIHLLVYTVLLDGAAWIGMHNGLPLWTALLVGAPPAIGFVLSWRIGITMTADAIVVRTYVRTRTFRYDDVSTVYDVSYSGFWNRYTSFDGWMGFGLRMLEVDPLRGRAVELPATMCGRRTSEALAEYLTDQGHWFRGVVRHFEGILRWDAHARDVSFTLDSSRNPDIDAAYTSKYGNEPATRSLTSTSAAQTTLRLEPR